MAEVAGQHIAVAISGQVGEASEQAATELEMALIRARKDALIRDHGAQDGVGVLATTPVIFDRDLDAIIEKSDWDGDGCIGRDEAAFAIALYLEIQEKRDSACCVIS